MYCLMDWAFVIYVKIYNKTLMYGEFFYPITNRPENLTAAFIIQ